MSSFYLYITFHLTFWVACVPLENHLAYIMYLFNLWISKIKTFLKTIYGLVYTEHLNLEVINWIRKKHASLSYLILLRVM